MSIRRYTEEKPSLGDLLGGGTIVYRVVSVSPERGRSPSGALKWVARLARATPEEEAVFFVMEE